MENHNLSLAVEFGSFVTGDLLTLVLFGVAAVSAILFGALSLKSPSGRQYESYGMEAAQLRMPFSNTGLRWTFAIMWILSTLSLIYLYLNRS
jgi:hypothetical protein